MEQILECGKSGDIVHQLLHAHAGFNDHLAGRTIDRGVDDRFYIIEGRRLPGLYGQSGSRKSCCGIQSWDTSRRRRRIFGALGWQWLLLNPVDQPTDLPGHWVLRRLLQESVQSLDAFVSFAEPEQCLPEHKLSRSGCVLALRDRDLRFIPSLVVGVLMKISVGKQAVRDPILCVGEDCLLQCGSGGGIVLTLDPGSAEKSQCLSVMRIQSCRRAEVCSGLIEISLLIIEIAHQEIQVRTCRREFERRIQLLLSLYEIARL